MRSYGVYASRWPLEQETVWTIVNRNAYNIAGRQMDVPLTPGMRYFDLYHGMELKPDTDGNERRPQLRTSKPTATAQSWPLPANQLADIKALMQRMAEMTAQPLASFSHEHTYLHAEHRSISPQPSPLPMLLPA